MTNIIDIEAWSIQVLQIITVIAKILKKCFVCEYFYILISVSLTVGLLFSKHSDSQDLLKHLFDISSDGKL